MTEILLSKFIKTDCCGSPVRYVDSDLTGEIWLYCSNVKCKIYDLACIRRAGDPKMGYQDSLHGNQVEKFDSSPYTVRLRYFSKYNDPHDGINPKAKLVYIDYLPTGLFIAYYSDLVQVMYPRIMLEAVQEEWAGIKDGRN